MSAAATLLTTNGWPTGLVGTLGYRVLDNTGAQKIARATAGVVADAGGNYHATPLLDRAWGAWLVIWDNGASGGAVQYAAQAMNVSASSPLFVASGFPTGLVGTLTYSVKDGDGNVLLAPTTSGIVEIGFGAYWVKPDSANLAGIRTIVWANGGAQTSETIDFEGGGPTGYFDDLTEADDLAAIVAGLSTYNAASSAVRAQALETGANRIDGRRYQGHRYDTRTPQRRQFPRIARGGNMPWAYAQPLVPPFPLEAGGVEIWDFDPSTNAVFVPQDVKLANLYEAESIIDGVRDKVIAAARAGLAAQSIGSASKTYFKPDLSQAAPLCDEAERLLRQYFLKWGNAL